MSRRPGPLKTKQPDAGRDPEVPPELWALPDRVALRANELGLTQARLAAACEVGQPKISKLLRYAGLHTLDARFVIKLAQALQISTDELLTGRRPHIVFETVPTPVAQPKKPPKAKAN